MDFNLDWCQTMVQCRRQTRLTRCLACIMSAMLDFYKVGLVAVDFSQPFFLSHFHHPSSPSLLSGPLSVPEPQLVDAYNASFFDVALHDDLKLSHVAVAVAHPPCSSFTHLLQRQAFHQYSPQAHPILPPPPKTSIQRRSRLTIPTSTHKTNSLLR